MSTKTNATIYPRSQQDPGCHGTGLLLAKFVIYSNNYILALFSFLLVGLAISALYVGFDWISQIELMPTFLILVALFESSVFLVTTLKMLSISKKRPGFILFFAILSAVVLSLGYGLGIHLMNNPQMVREYVVDEVQKFYDGNQEFKEIWKHVEDELQCCGVKKRSFWTTVLSCPTKMRACADVVEPLLYVYINIELLHLLFWACVTVQLTDFLLSIYVYACYSCIFKYHQVPNAVNI